MSSACCPVPPSCTIKRRPNASRSGSTDSAASASAGHLPPLLHTGEGAHFLAPHGPLLGINVPRPPGLEFVLPPGGTLVLYTDGLVERRDTEIDVRLAVLAEAATPVDEDLDRYCGRLLELTGQDVDDDIAVVAARWRPSTT